MKQHARSVCAASAQLEQQSTGPAHQAGRLCTSSGQQQCVGVYCCRLAGVRDAALANCCCCECGVGNVLLLHSFCMCCLQSALPSKPQAVYCCCRSGNDCI